MKNLTFAVLALATALATAPAAMAAGTTTIYVDIWGTNTSDPTGTSGLGITGGGTLQGIAEGGGLYDITGGSFEINGQTATVIVNGSFPTVVDSAGFHYDDALNLSQSPNFVDNAGLLFSLPGNEQVNIGLDSNGVVNYNDILESYNTATHVYNSATSNGYDIGMSASLTPEPSSWLLMGTGLLFLVGFLYRKAKPGFNQAA